jgi:hypothetical protein
MILCEYMQCFEMRYRAALYLMKSDLLRHLREEHDRWWARYERLYERGMHLLGTNGSGRAQYTPVAQEMLTRCRMHDNLFNSVMTIDLTTVKDFGNYCRRVFLEINKLKPAFPESAVSVGVFDQTVRQLRKLVMKQYEAMGARGPVHPFDEAQTAKAG